MSHNLDELPAEIRAKIERDKKRWHQAWVMTRNRQSGWIRQWLTGVEDADDRNDWRHRLNRLRHRKK